MKYLTFIILILISQFLVSHPKFPEQNIESFQFYEERADSLHGFDVLKYDLTIEIDDQNQFIDGMVISTILAEENLGEISFELEGLNVDNVLVNGSEAVYNFTNGVITTQLANISADDEFELTIEYSGNPILCQNPYALGMFFQTSGIFTISDPNASRYWWPCYDHPWDKAIVDLHITVRDDWKVAANGLRSEIIDNQDGTMTHHWLGYNPMATYLVSVVARNFVELNDSYGDIPIHNFVPPNMESNAIQDFTNLPLMMEIYTNKFGVYPFEKYGNSVTNFSTYGAMEHQTMTTLANYLITGNQTYETVIAHELAHQWFGNCLTPLTWADVWLSEGFATYSEAIFVEEMEGYEAMLNYLHSNIQNYYLSWAGSANHTIYNPPYNAIFTPVTYEKAASILHMLRNLVGDDTFYDILQSYFLTFKNGNVITTDFKNICEQESGLDLSQFFQQWIYQSGIPTITYTYFTNEEESKIASYAQTQASSGTGFYLEIPLQITLENEEIYHTHVSAEPQTPAETIIHLENHSTVNIAYDPENWILNRGYTEKRIELGEVYAGGLQNLITWNELWNEIEVDGYNVYRSDSENGNFEKINGDELVTTYFFADESILLGEEYFYTVRAVKIMEGESFVSLPATPKSVISTEFPMEQGILVIDESFDGAGIPGNPNDAMVDDFYQNIINAPFSTYDIAASGSVSLDVIRNYSTIIYHDDDISQQMISNYAQDFGSYLLAGGNLLISGWKTMSDIPAAFFQTFTSIEEWQATTQIQFIGAYSESYPALAIDPEKVNPAFNGALMYVYTLEENDNAIYHYHGTENSVHEGKIVAVKEDNLVLLGFPLYYCFDDDAEQFMNQLLNEFGEITSSETDVINAVYTCHAYPNPFNPNLTIAYYLPEKSAISMKIYNVKGQKVKDWELINQPTGNHQLIWNGTDKSGKKVSSGIYFYHFKTQNFEQIQKVLLVK
jgi:hypothetical protein